MEDHLIDRYLHTAVCFLCLVQCTAGWLKAQEMPPASGVTAFESKGEASDIADPPVSKFPLDVAGYISFRAINNDAFSEHDYYREYAGSIFLSKKAGRWLFHSEFNANTTAEFVTDGIHLVPSLPHLTVELQTVFVNYTWRDWLQMEAGFLFVPTYWRTHRYQSTNLTVDEPLIDQNVFPTAFKGVLIHGDKYFEHGGFSYVIYGGASQEPDIFDSDAINIQIDPARAMGGKLVVHVPSWHFFDSFDIGYHRLEQQFTDRHEDLDGAELRLEKGRARLLGEFAHMSAKPKDGSAGFFRQGFYLQPSYRLTRQLYAVGSYDRLNRDSRFADESGLGRQSLGLTYRPQPSISLKIEADRYEPQWGRLPAYYGVTAGVVYFFHLP
jgi:hypothetical protein